MLDKRGFWVNELMHVESFYPTHQYKIKGVIKTVNGSIYMFREVYCVEQ